MNNYDITYDSAWDLSSDRTERWIPNESSEGALEFFLADNAIEPRQGDLAMIHDRSADETLFAHAYLDETRKLVWEDPKALAFA